MNRFLVLAALTLAVVAIWVGPAQAQITTLRVNFEYAVKFVCGTSTEDPLQAVRGFYATAVNVHNPGAIAAMFAKKVAIAPPFELPGPISKFRLAQL